MKRRIFLLAMFVTFCNVIVAQQLPQFAWNKGIGGTAAEKVVDMVVDNNGNTIVTGTFRDTVNFNPPNAGTFTSLMQSATQFSSDVFVAKYDASGNYLWAKTIGGNTQDEAAGVKVDAQGNIYLLAHFYDSVDYDNAPGWQGFMAQPGLSDIILMKYDSNGNIIWAKQIGGPSGDKAVDLALDNQNNIIITGTFFGTADFDPSPAFDTLTYITIAPCSFQTPCTPDMFVAKYDSNGNHIWAKQIGSPNNENPRNIECDRNGNIYISGIFVLSSDFNLNNTPSAVLNSVGTSDVYIAKYAPNGNYIWAKQLGSSSSMNINDLKFDDDDNFVITGGFQGNTDFDWSADSTILSATPGNNSIYLAKYDSSANLLWAKKMNHPNPTGQDNGNSISFDAQKNIYATGFFHGQNCDFNPDPNTTNFLSSAGSNNNETFVAKYSPLGSYIWAHSIGESGTEEGICIKISNDNSLYLATNFGSSNVNFDVFTNSTNGIFSTNGGSDFTISKFTQCSINLAVVSQNNSLTAFANNANYQWLNCDIGYLPLQGAVSSSFSPTQSGNYACQISLGSCTDTTACYNINLCSNFNNAINVSNNGVFAASLNNATYQWLNCAIGFAEIVGATNQSFTPTQNGTYACKISTTTCTDTSDCKEITNVGLNDFEANSNVILYPNPAQDFITVNFAVDASNIIVQISDVIGKAVEVKSTPLKNNITINTQNLSKGVYSIKFIQSTTNKTIIKSFVKE